MTASGATKEDGGLDQGQADRQLIQAVIRQDAGAWNTFVRRYSDLVYTHYSAEFFTAGDAAVEHAKVFEALRAQDFALLRKFDGGAPGETYLLAELPNLFGRRLVQLLREDRQRGLAAFGRFFDRRFDHLIRHGLERDESKIQDLSQEIFLRLADAQQNRLLDYYGGSFVGFVSTIIRNLKTDIYRETHGYPRPPTAVKRISPLAERIWDAFQSGCPENELANRVYRAPAPRGTLGEECARSEVLETLRLLKAGNMLARTKARDIEVAITSTGRDGAESELPLPSPDSDPAVVLSRLQQKQAEEECHAIVQSIRGGLPPDMALFVRYAFDWQPPKKASEIARLMNRSVAEIYKLRERTMAFFQKEIKRRGAENPYSTV